LAAVLAGASLGVMCAIGRPDSSPGAAQASVGTACTTRLLADWSDGRIDGTYPIRCYRAALRSLPADLQVYSSASDDIAQALSQRIVQSRAQAGSEQKAKPVRKLAHRDATRTTAGR
jgi:hypothetical protein